MAAETTRSRAGQVEGAVSALRPRQWLKNVLVLAAPLGAGTLFHPDVLAASAVAFVAMSLAASGGYLVNDVLDVDRDRAHPEKRRRPVADGSLSRPAALTTAVVLLATGTALGFAVRPQLGLTVAGYVATTTLYSLWLKHEPVIELALLSSGFLLRAVAGGAATGVPLSDWFLIVAAFGSLFMAAGKRASELDRLGRGQPLVDEEEPVGAVRRSLAGYSAGYLRFVWGLAATVAVVGYCLWAFQVGADQTSSLPWATCSVVPFVLGMLRYAVEIDRGSAEAPELAVLGDHVLLALGGCWVVLFGLGALGV